MTSGREPGRGPGGFGVVSTFGSLDGWTFADADEFLTSHAELVNKFVSAGSYFRYLFRDNSELIIRPNGEIIRLPRPMYNSDGTRIKGLRLRITNGELLRSAAWHEMPRDQQEWVVFDDNAN